MSILTMSILTSEIATKLNGSLTGKSDLLICDAKSIHKASRDDISFIGQKKNIRDLNSSQAVVILVSDEIKDDVTLSSHESLECIIYVPHAQTAMIELLQLIRPRKTAQPTGISEQANIHNTVQIGDKTEVHSGVIIEADVIIGERCRIFPGVHIGIGCQIGNDVTLYPNVVLYDDVTLGDRVAINASSVIGADGYGYQFADGKHNKIPHFGGVRIGNDVEIGACTTIDRGMIEDTIIGEGTKLDNHVMIAHNCELGKHNIMVSQVGMAGSCTTGDYVICGGNVGIADHVHLGNQVTIGSKAVVHKNVADGETQLGYPAEPVERAIKIVMAQRKLPEMRKDFKVMQKLIKKLEEKIEQLENRSPDKDKNSAA